MQSPEDPGGRPITQYRTINESLVPFTNAGHLCGFMRSPGSAGKPRFGRSLALPPLSVALCLEQILLVVVVLVVNFPSSAFDAAGERLDEIAAGKSEGNHSR
jgi:hypothetical protein